MTVGDAGWEMSPGMKSSPLDSAVQAMLDRLGPAMRTIRRLSDRTQKELAAASGLAQAQLSRYEKGHEVPTLPSLLKYLGAAGASFVDLEAALNPGDPSPKLAAAIRGMIEKK